VTCAECGYEFEPDDDGQDVCEICLQGRLRREVPEAFHYGPDEDEEG
jgi:rubredoxin